MSVMSCIEVAYLLSVFTWHVSRIDGKSYDYNYKVCVDYGINL